MADTGMFTILALSNKEKIPGVRLILLYGQDFFCPEILHLFYMNIIISTARFVLGGFH